MEADVTETPKSTIMMYSTAWCPDCRRAKGVLKRLEVDFTEIDVDHDKEGYQVVVDYNGGKRVVPTIFFPDGSVLVEPSNQELVDKLIALGLANQ
ncbi:NrdH-redoxin [bacterium]|nr:NrdH-redoxin [bacterium]MCB2179250.1 NrdH-redoxin [bacterium]